MAVARITAPKAWFLKAALAVADHKRLRRELERAAERHGLAGEVHGEEARILLERLPGDERALQAVADIEASELREATRPRARDIALGLANYRGRYDPADPSYIPRDRGLKG
jgi:hypothetical protein